ncbi:MAG: hypothetical protein R3E32_03810 [Chitinophagales bacterium]
MAVSTQLFDLIQSMDKSEKRYFKLHCSKYKIEDNQYQKVFDAIDSQSSYDENDLKVKFKKEKFVKQFHVIKNYLYNLVLDSLWAFHSGKNINQQISELIDKSEILSEKGLFLQSLKLLQKAATFAEEKETFEHCLLIYKRLKLLYIRKIDVDNFEKRIDEYIEKEQWALQQLSNLMHYEWLSNKTFQLYHRTHVARNLNDEEAYRVLLADPLLQNSADATSSFAKMHFFNIKALCHETIGDLKRSCESRQELVELFEANKDLIQRSFVNYLVSLNNLLHNYNELRDYPNFYKVLDKIKNVAYAMDRKLTQVEELLVFRSSTAMVFNALVKNGRFEEAAAMIPDIEAGFEKFGNKLNEAFRYPFYYFFAYTHFALQNYPQCLVYLEHFIHNNDLTFNRELFRFGRILYLITHYESENWELLPSIIRSTQRYLSQLQKPYASEKLLLNFFKKVPYADDNAAFLDLQKKMNKLMNDPHFQTELEHFDYLAWVQSKIEGKGFIEAYSTKLQLSDYPKNI